MRLCSKFLNSRVHVNSGIINYAELSCNCWIFVASIPVGVSGEGNRMKRFSDYKHNNKGLIFRLCENVLPKFWALEKWRGLMFAFRLKKQEWLLITDNWGCDRLHSGGHLREIYAEEDRALFFNDSADHWFSSKITFLIGLGFLSDSRWIC